MFIYAILICVIYPVKSCQELEISVDYPLPVCFKIGTATSAYQTEGAWNEDYKTPSIWDNFTHKHYMDNGDKSCDSYHHMQDDVAMLKFLGVKFYRFSISWSRILPYGTLERINLQAVKYYQSLLCQLNHHGIEPMVVLYHWDLPQTLQDLGGWLNPKMRDYFIDYATYMFSLYAPSVNYWITFNEPVRICQDGYGSGILPPGIISDGVGSYACGHQILMAHAMVYHRYKNYFKEKYGGKVSIILDGHWQEAATDFPQDQQAAEISMQFNLGWFAHPIYSTCGNYPPIMIERIARRSYQEGYNISRLPSFSELDIEIIRGTSDFFAISYYSTSQIYFTNEMEIGTPSFIKDVGVLVFNHPCWKTVPHTNWGIAPWGLRKILKWIDEEYNHPEIIVTGNSFYDYDDTIDDTQRINFYKDHLSNVLLSIYEDGVKVTGFTAWSLMDHLEWQHGFRIKTGLFYVDFKSSDLTRYPRKSAYFFKNLIATHCLTSNCNLKYSYYKNCIAMKNEIGIKLNNLF